MLAYFYIGLQLIVDIMILKLLLLILYNCQCTQGYNLLFSGEYQIWIASWSQCINKIYINVLFPNPLFIVISITFRERVKLILQD
ncbi:unnamed protein product [Blepharisma stoltei]|uniref:Secreted protein n=1 Tax=Blepharisma stoltei TaxID=1481888 RepID=A0AAU9JW09_9CILI|nr:unnamed protein product [Blepharisma stoltei]